MKASTCLLSTGHRGPTKVGHDMVGCSFQDDGSGGPVQEGLEWDKRHAVVSFQDIGGHFKFVKRDSRDFLLSLYTVPERDQVVKEDRARFLLELLQCH